MYIYVKFIYSTKDTLLNDISKHSDWNRVPMQFIESSVYYIMLK